MTQCRVKGFFSQSYGKFNEGGLASTVVMEYDNFLEFLIPFMNPTPPSDYINYIYNENVLEQYADFIMYTLPLPRY